MLYCHRLDNPCHSSLLYALQNKVYLKIALRQSQTPNDGSFSLLFILDSYVRPGSNKPQQITPFIKFIIRNKNTEPDFYVNLNYFFVASSSFDKLFVNSSFLARRRSSLRLRASFVFVRRASAWSLSR